MSKTLHYLYDPLCGWCYGASSAVAAVAALSTLNLNLLPSGLFAGAGARPMSDDFASFAWTNDQRIERLTGQRFTQRYRDAVLGNRQQRFDSGPATLALTAVALTSPDAEALVLSAIQKARYVEGRDITRPESLASVLQTLGLEPAAERLVRADADLIAASRARVAQARTMLDRLRVSGVPTFVLEVDGEHRVLPASTAFSEPRTFVAQIDAV